MCSDQQNDKKIQHFLEYKFVNHMTMSTNSTFDIIKAISNEKCFSGKVVLITFSFKIKELQSQTKVNEEDKSNYLP